MYIVHALYRFVKGWGLGPGGAGGDVYARVRVIHGLGKESGNES